MTSGKLIERQDAIFVTNVADYINAQDISETISFLDDVEVEEIKKVLLFSEIKNDAVKDFMSAANRYVKDIVENKYSQVIDVTFSECTWEREPELVKWEPGSGLAAHIDGPEKKQPPQITIGALIYLNSDYEGGELSFPEYDIIIKPKFGDLVIFPCHYLHQVSIVKGENKYRYTLPLFYTFTYKENADV